jgi:N-acyl-D-amino-acid deacylase
MTNRGIVRPGAMADLALFDPAAFTDHASNATPEAPATGMARVWVNGVEVWNGAPTGAYPGRFIKRTDR